MGKKRCRQRKEHSINRGVLYLSFFLLILYSCGNSSIKQSLKIRRILIDSVSLNIPDEIQNAFLSVRNYHIDNNLLYIHFNLMGKLMDELYVYNLDQKKLINKLKLCDFEDEIDLLNFTNDTLFVIYQHYPNENIIQGILKKYSLKNLSLKDSFVFFQNSEAINIKHEIINNNVDYYHKGLLYFKLIRLYKKPFIKFPLLNAIDIKTKKIINVPVWYPFSDSTITNNNLNLYYYTTILNNNIYIQFSSSLVVYKINMGNNKISYKLINSDFLKKIYNIDESSNEIYKHKIFLNELFKVVEVDNVPYFHIGITLPDTFLKSNFVFYSVLDTNFRSVYEDIIDANNREPFLEWYHAKRYNNNTNIACYIYNNQIIIKKIKYEFEKSNHDVLYSKLSYFNKIESENTTSNIFTFFENAFKTKPKENIILIKLFNCPKCNNNFLRFFNENPKIINSYNIIFYYRDIKERSYFEPLLNIDREIKNNCFFISYDSIKIFMQNNEPFTIFTLNPYDVTTFNNENYSIFEDRIKDAIDTLTQSNSTNKSVKVVYQ